MDKLLSNLGINWQDMILQLLAFAILVFILAKWVYPPILAMLDRREKLIEDSVKNAKKANDRAALMDAEIERKLTETSEQASDILDAARKQNEQILIDGEKEAQKRADFIVSSARKQLAEDIESARKTLRDETVELVGMATEKIIREKVDSKKDQELIRESVGKKSSSAKKGAKK